MRLRALRPFMAYRPENCSFISATAAGEEITDPGTARYLLSTHCADVEPADDEAAEVAARYAPPEQTVTDDAQPVNNPVDGAPAAPVLVVVGEAGPELVVAGGIAVTPVTPVDATPYNATVEHPSEGGTGTPTAEEEPVAEPVAAFDPAEHTVDEVIEYVQANPDRRAAVLALETAADGKQRVTIVKALAD